MYPILSVLIPTYNDYKLFLRSVKTYLNNKRIIILVSDDSDDHNEKDLIKMFCLRNNIKYFEGPRISPGENWNNLLKKINTPFFVLNHHDEYPTNLEYLDILNPKNIGLVVLPCSSKVGGGPTIKSFSWQQRWFSAISMLLKNPTFNMIIAPTASLIINSKYKNILFDIKLKWFIDAEWYSRLFLKSKNDKNKIIFFPISRIISYQSKNSITQSLKGKLKTQIIKEKEYLRSKGLLPNKLFILLQFVFLIIITFHTKFKLVIYKMFVFLINTTKKFMNYLFCI
tara:strand:+ start:1415 stop:2263 length:849 start_codon:yes stop_codon:yes gene_type:complete